ncbi:MAG: hypothetical protein ATN34_01675 [Epulopiscium sp. Nele67-Bin002]|nr:MAG: hypothetical protein ATN34_01675 [Epulopiscium sp. Nele67-Bin002]
MRVISGKCRGTKLIAPDGTTTRPTADRVKETIFNIINFDLPRCRFLDLFSGSGAIGIEALSRGAECAVFVEADEKALAVIKKNLEKTRLAQFATVYKSRVEEILREDIIGTFDIIFIDPPYNYELEKIVNFIVDRKLLNPGGKLIIENSRDSLDIITEGLVIKRTKLYATTKVNIYEEAVKLI